MSALDDALEAIERENPKLKGFIEKNRYARLEIPQENLGGLIDLIATIPFEHADLHAKDILGHVYEYFLGQFALAEGKKGGQYFTPKSIVSLIVRRFNWFIRFWFKNNYWLTVKVWISEKLSGFFEIHDSEIKLAVIFVNTCTTPYDLLKFSH